MTTDQLTREARTNLSVAQTYLMDGAPTDALRCALNACNALFVLVCRRYIRLDAPDLDSAIKEVPDAKKTRAKR